jgi:hypothetical protein
LISIDLRKFAAMVALGVFAALGTAEQADAQGNSRKDNRDAQKAAKQAEKVAKEHDRFESERQAEWRRRNKRLVVARSGNDRSNGAGYYNGDANANTNRDGRYRVVRNGSSYNTTGQGVELLRRAVNAGYEQGFEAGRNDRSNRGRGDWSSSAVYRSGTSGYETYVDREQYQYYFRQGFQRGYQDGSDRQYATDHEGDYQYGNRQGGSMNILNSILGSILNVQSY